MESCLVSCCDLISHPSSQEGLSCCCPLFRALISPGGHEHSSDLSGSPPGPLLEVSHGRAANVPAMTRPHIWVPHPDPCPPWLSPPRSSSSLPSAFGLQPGDSACDHPKLFTLSKNRRAELTLSVSTRVEGIRFRPLFLKEHCEGSQQGFISAVCAVWVLQRSSSFFSRSSSFKEGKDCAEPI